jgi:hypothetical protein
MYDPISTIVALAGSLWTKYCKNSMSLSMRNPWTPLNSDKPLSWSITLLDNIERFQIGLSANWTVLPAGINIIFRHRSSRRDLK